MVSTNRGLQPNLLLAMAVETALPTALLALWNGRDITKVSMS
jgi:hypothetical protein